MATENQKQSQENQLCPQILSLETARIQLAIKNTQSIFPVALPGLFLDKPVQAAERRFFVNLSEYADTEQFQIARFPGS